MSKVPRWICDTAGTVRMLAVVTKPVESVYVAAMDQICVPVAPSKA